MTNTTNIPKTATFMVTFTTDKTDDLDARAVGVAYLEHMDAQMFADNCATGVTVEVTYEESN